MVNGIFDSEEVRCWGRGDEIEQLLEPIHDPNQPRSMTLVWGDSGIGKTTLLEEFHRRVAGGDYLAGIYQCQRDTGADPLLKCLQSLIEKRIYTLENWPDLMVEGLKDAKARLQNPVELGRLFSGTLDTIAKAPFVGKWAEVVSKGLGVVADAAGPRTAIPAQMVERLAPEVFADVIEVLHAALPGRPLIFVLDNLSAVAESRAPSADVTDATIALLSFLQTKFLSCRDLHFVVSWKHIAPTRPSFEELRTTIRQYQGRDLELSVISDESVSEWAAHDFEWFRNSSREEREQVVKIAGGWPEAIAEWKKQGIDRFDPRRLQQITDDSVQGRYATLEAELIDPELAKDRPRLYQLSIMPKILTEPALARLWDCAPQEVHDFLRTWSGRALLKTEDGRYLFAHEKKQDVARRILGEALFNGGQSEGRALYNFYLSNVGFPNAEQPEAGLYLFFSLALQQSAALTDAETNLLSELIAMMVGSGSKPRLNSGALQMATRAPWNTRFLIYHLAASGLPETGDLLETIGNGLLDDTAAAKSDPANLAKGLVNAANAYGNAERMEDVERLLERLQELAQQHPEQADIALEVATGLFNAAVDYGNAERMEDVERLLVHIRVLAGRFPEDAAVAVQLAFGLLVGAMSANGSGGDDAELASLLEHFGDSEAFRPVRALLEQRGQRGGGGDDGGPAQRTLI